jgi:hypothetical protein
VNTFSMPVWLARVLPGVDDTFSIGGSAVAGPVPIGLSRVCDIVPLSVCGDPGDYRVGGKEEIWLKSSSCSGSGYYQLLVGCGARGGNSLRAALAGTCSTCSDGYMETEPGKKVGPVYQGLNTRFGIYQGSISSSEAPPDVVTDTDYDASGNYFWYDDYVARLKDGLWNNPPRPDGIGVPGRRIVVVPFIKPPKGGRTEVEVVGYGCFFLTRPADHTGKQVVYGQFIERCEADGSIAQSPPATGSSFNLYKIVLYKDPTSPDS